MKHEELKLGAPCKVSKLSFGDKLQIVKYNNHDELEILQDSVIPFVKHFEKIIVDAVLAFKADGTGLEVVLKEQGRFWVPLKDGSEDGVVYLV